MADNHTDLSKHRKGELLEGIVRTKRERPRIARESSPGALAANERSRQELVRELDRREQAAGPPRTPVGLARVAVGGALTVAARGLTMAGEIAAVAARAVRPSTQPESASSLSTNAPGARPSSSASRPTTPERAETPAAGDRNTAPVPETSLAPDDAGVTAPPTEPVPEAPTHARTYDTHAAELADATAAEITATLDELSTDELRALYEHESRNKRRKTVLRAVEKAFDPTGDGQTAARRPDRDSPTPEPASEIGGVPTGRDAASDVST